MTTMMGDRRAMANDVYLCRNFPTFLAPQLCIASADLIQRESPLVYNSSAGQDRTAFTTAMVPSALAVSRETITSDYNLSTTYRRPGCELPKIDHATAKANPVATLFAAYQKDGASSRPRSLKAATANAHLDGAFSEIDARWGSVDAFLEKEVGATKGDLALLRLTCLE